MNIIKKLLAIIVLSFLFITNVQAVKFIKKPCSKLNWSEPCNCYDESSYAKKKYCNFKMGKKKDKWIPLCAERAGEYKPEFRKKIYNSCMKDFGF